MLDVEVLGAAAAPSELPSVHEIERLCAAAAARAGVHDGHLAVEFVDAARIAALNGEHRDEAEPTDVLSFPIDGPRLCARVLDGDAARAHAHDRARVNTRARDRAGPPEPEPELGDVIICPERTADIREAIVHGVLHLMGMDHETDDGEMIALQREVLAQAGR